MPQNNLQPIILSAVVDGIFTLSTNKINFSSNHTGNLAIMHLPVLTPHSNCAFRPSHCLHVTMDDIFDLNHHPSHVNCAIGAGFTDHSMG